MRRFMLIVALFVVAFAPTAAAAPVAHHQLPAECAQVGVLSNGNTLWECAPDATATPEPSGTPTDTATPTDTPEPGATETPPPTSTQAAGIAPYPDAPLCAGHDRRAYHSLWDAFEGCHFDHEHGDNPHDLDAVLGTELYGLMGGEISYPWQTFSAAGLENDLKHAGYTWHVRGDIPCDATAPSPCITAFRALVHQHPTGRDATVQYHSYVFEAATSDGGYILYGGWVDFGDLHSPEGTIVVDVPDNHDSNTCAGAGRHKQHSPQDGGFGPQIIWYGASRQEMDCGPRGFVSLSVSVHDVWDITDPADPARPDDYYCYPDVGCTNNATLDRLHFIQINAVTRWLFIRDAAGRINWTGYADRYGLLRNDGLCNAPSVDCAPVSLRNLRWNYNYEASDSATALSRHEHDIYFDGQTSGWAQPVP